MMRNFPSWFPMPNFNSWMSAILLATIVSLATSLALPLIRLFSFLLGLFYWLSYLLGILLNLFPEFVKNFILWIFQIILVFLVNIFTFITTISSPLLLILPIVVIAFADHFFNLFLDRYFPDIRSSQMEKVTGFFPSLISWWEGFYGLLVIMISLLCSDIVLSLFPILAFNSDISNIETASTSRLFFWYYIALMLFSQPLYTPIARLFIWIIVAAYLYHFETTVRQHLISVNSSK